MKELRGKISDKLREKFPPEAPEWNPHRPGERRPVEKPERQA